MRVLITRKLPEEGIASLFAHCEVEINYLDRPFSTEELKLAITDKDGVLCVGDTIDEAVLKAAPNLKVISNYGVGYDNIDVSYANKKGIIIANLPHEVTQSTAEMTWALILALARRVVEADTYVRSRDAFQTGPEVFVGTHLYGKRLGIIGLGRIGIEVARRAIPFGMEVVYSDCVRKVNEETKLPISYLTLPELLMTADIITVHVPLTTETYHLVDTKEFKMMKETAYIINISRGPVINEQALIKALIDGKIKGAGLDVFENEPSVPLSLRKLSNVVLTPHIGTSTYETRVAMAKRAVENIITVLHRGLPDNVINYPEEE
jgi:glyoxylate reductase